MNADEEVHRCNGAHPCSNCDAFKVACQYPQSSRSQKSNSDQDSIQAMQKRLAELESMMSSKESDQVHSPSHRALSSRRASRSHRSESMADGTDSNPDDGVRVPVLQPSSPEPDDTSVFDMVRDLSIGGFGGYVGSTSQITMGRMIGFMMGSQRRSSTRTLSGLEPEDSSVSTRGDWEHLSPKSASTGLNGSKAVIEIPQIPADIADKLFFSYVRHISTRWPAVHPLYARYLHGNRATLLDAYETTMLRLIYAIGGRFLETTGETGNYNSEQHYDLALASLEEIMQQHSGLRPIQILALVAIYNIRSPRGPGAWTAIGMAMRQCIDIGLHRRIMGRVPPLVDEMRKRLFWTCYCLDRQLSIILGRPFAISDRDIDVELPVDVDDASEDEELIRRLQIEARSKGPEGPPATSTSMTGFIHICRLRMIESEIQQTIYRVDKESASIKSDVEKFIARLEHWRATMPLDAQKLPNFDIMCPDGYGDYMVYYYKCMRFLLYPIILSPTLADAYHLQKCADACAGVCRTYKKMHQTVPVGFSVMALHSIFVAGLTLLYCTWAAPGDVFGIGTSNGLNACSIVLYIIAERWVGARKYRDAFEVVKQAVLESVEEGGDEPRKLIPGLQTGVRAAFQSQGGTAASALNSAASGFPHNRGELSTMINDIEGGVEVEATAFESSDMTLKSMLDGSIGPQFGMPDTGGVMGGVDVDFDFMSGFETFPFDMGYS